MYKLPIMAGVEELNKKLKPFLKEGVSIIVNPCPVMTAVGGKVTRITNGFILYDKNTDISSEEISIPISTVIDLFKK